MSEMPIIDRQLLPLTIPEIPVPAPTRVPLTPLMMLAPMLPRDWSRHPKICSLNIIIII